jgi:hypothetical protein
MKIKRLITLVVIMAIISLSYTKDKSTTNSYAQLTELKNNTTSLGDSTADAEVNAKQFTKAELKHKWQGLTKGKGWNKLMKEIDMKGLKRLEESSYGFSGTLKDTKTGKTVDIEYGVFDFYSPSAKKDSSFQTGSMVYRKIGSDIYRAYIVFPKGESDVQKNFAAAQEWFVDEKDEVKKANSFGTCFNRCVLGGDRLLSIYAIEFGGYRTVRANCSSNCFRAIVNCGSMVTILSFVLGAPGVPILLAGFAICAGAECAACLTYCALSSLYRCR